MGDHDLTLGDDDAALDRTMRKGEFARLIDVSPARISQYLSAGILDDSALEGRGRYARIRVAVALEQVRTRRHLGQSLGNGLATKLDHPQETVPSRNRFEPPTLDGEEVAALSVSDAILTERLEFERRRNRQATIQDAVDAGQLVPAAEARREFLRSAQRLVGIYDQMANDLALELASLFKLPQRDVAHAVTKIIRAKREIAAKALRSAGEELPPTVKYELQQ